MDRLSILPRSHEPPTLAATPCRSPHPRQPPTRAAAHPRPLPTSGGFRIGVTFGRLLYNAGIMRISVDSSDAVGLHRVGVSALRQGKIGVAREVLTRVAALAPDRPEVHANLGAARSADGLPEAGELSYMMALALAPDFVGARLGLARLLASRHRPDEAVAQLRAAVASGAAPSDVVGCVRAIIGGANAGSNEAAELFRTRFAAGVAQAIGRVAKDCLDNSRTRRFFRWTLTLDRVPETRYIARELWQMAIGHFWPTASWRLITHLYCRYGAYSGRCRAIFRGYTHRAPRQLSATAATAIQRQLDDALAAWESAPDLPVLHKLLIREADRPIDQFRQTKILFCLATELPRRTAGTEPLARGGAAANGAQTLQSTACGLGLQTELLLLDEIRKFGVAAFRSRLRDTIERMRPDLIFFENNQPSDDEALNAAWARDIRTRWGTKICVMIVDVHANSKHDWKLAYWRDDVDRIVYFEPGFRAEGELGQRVFLTPVICNEMDMLDEGKPRNIAVSFIGSFRFSRTYWIAACR